MSGYLGRMAAAAGAPKPSLHPFAGSIYENGARTWAAKPTSRGDAHTAADPERHLVVEANDGGETDVGLRTPLVSQRAGRDAQDPAAPPPGYAPLYPQRRDSRFAPVSPSSSRIPNPVEQELTLPQATPAELGGEDRRVSDRPGGGAARDAQTGEASSSRLLPLAPTVTRAPSATGRVAAIESIVSGPTGRDGASSSVAPRTADNPPRHMGRALTMAELSAHAAPQRRSESATREFLRGSSAPDQSVEIHIGRVEVLAVAPPAPRMPAASQNRTTSLADYLARRNGRTW